MGIWQLAQQFYGPPLFLFEEADRERFIGVGGDCVPAASALGEPAAGSAGAAKLGLQHASRKTANIRNEFGSEAVP